MIHSRVFILFFLLFASYLPSLAQTSSADIIERSIEIIAEINEDAELDYTTLVDDLTAYLERPLDLNTARSEELLSLGFVSDIQVAAIMAHRAKYGRFIAVEELQAVTGLTSDVIASLRYFVRVSSDINSLSITPKGIWENADHELFLRSDGIVEEVKGSRPISDEDLADSPNSRYLGSPIRYYMRYRFKYQNRISIGFTAEKDAGEEFFQGTQKNGFDYYSAHAFISGFKTVEKLAIGDYHVQMGQGLTAWTGLAFGKSADLFSIKRNPKGITPYRSVDENNFLRGAAVTLKRQEWELTLFGSSKSQDANILTGDTLDPELATSFTALQLSGFHRTPSEVADKNQLQVKIGGAELKWRRDALTVGVRGIGVKYDKSLDRNTVLYNQFGFTNSDQNSVIGADYDYVTGNLNIFGEVARSQNGGLAMLHGGYLVLDPRLTVGVLYRNYQKDFQGTFSNSLGENSTIANEKGLFMGVIVKPADAWKVSAWVDRYSFPWMKYLVDAPSDGYEVLGQINYRPNKKFETYFKYRYRERPKNAAGDYVIDKVSATAQHNYRVHFSYKTSETVQLRSRIETTDYYREDNGTSHGVVIYQDLIIKPKDFPVDLSLRYALFDSDAYDARLYAYEQDVLYFYSIPAYSGKGSRYYAVVRYSIKRNIDLWVKWARWHYTDRDVISSGLTEIEGNVRSDVRVQLRFKF